MKSSLILLSLALGFGQSNGGEWVLTPQLAAGVELVYSGTSTEESLLPGVQYTRTYRIDNHLLVLAAEAQTHDIAFMTTISAREPGEQPKYKPVSVKLELTRIDAQGRVKAAGNINGPIALPTLLEVGCFVEAPANRVSKNSVWEAPDEGRPPRSWTVVGSESCGGLMCAKLEGQQQSEDWDRPRADRAAWRRRDTVWLSLQMGVAVKVERTLERRDPARREPSHRTVTHYVLESRLRYPGKLFDDRKREAVQAKRFGDDAGPFLKQPAQSANQIDALLRKVSFHIENTPSTPYRKAVVHLAQRIESARKGELLLVDYATEEPVTPIGPLRVGQKAPDCVLNDLISQQTVRLNRLLGRPVLVLYYNPHTTTGVEVLGFAKNLTEKMGDRVTVAALAVTNDTEFAQRQHAEMKLPFSIFEGSALRLAFAVEATPRFIVLDGDGILRATTTGWSRHVGDELLDELRRCSSKDGAAP